MLTKALASGVSRRQYISLLICIGGCNCATACNVDDARAVFEPKARACASLAAGCDTEEAGAEPMSDASVGALRADASGGRASRLSTPDGGASSAKATDEGEVEDASVGGGGTDADNPPVDASRPAPDMASDASAQADAGRQERPVREAATPKEAGQTGDAPASYVGPPISVTPTLVTESVANDAEDPAIWVHPTQPERSLFIVTNKAAAPDGSLVIYNLQGKVVQTITSLDRPNNVDVRDGFVFGGERVSIAVVTERFQQRLRVFLIDASSGVLSDISGEQLSVFSGQTGEQAAPMGIALYRRPADSAMFAIVSRKHGPTEGYLWQYLLEEAASGQVRATLVRQLGNFSGSDEIESVVVDDELGYVYYSDEGDGIHKWHANPDHPGASTELAKFGQNGFLADREGLAIRKFSDGTGYIVATDQQETSSVYHFFAREGAPADKHDHSVTLKTVSGGADQTDGLEIASVPMGANFPNGLLIVMNASDKNYFVYDWRSIAVDDPPLLRIE